MKPKVLLIDDDVPLLSALKRQLKPSFEVEVFSDSLVAAQYFHQSKFELAVIDISMPSVDGFALLDELKRVQPHVPAVMLSGDMRPDSVVTAMKKGAVDYLVKPFEDPKRLLTRLTQAMKARPMRRVKELLDGVENLVKPLPRYTLARNTVLTEFQKAYLERLMQEANGNLSAASRLSGIDRANLRRVLAKLKKSR